MHTRTKSPPEIRHLSADKIIAKEPFNTNTLFEMICSYIKAAIQLFKTGKYQKLDETCLDSL